MNKFLWIMALSLITWYSSPKAQEISRNTKMDLKKNIELCNINLQQTDTIKKDTIKGKDTIKREEYLIIDGTYIENGDQKDSKYIETVTYDSISHKKIIRLKWIYVEDDKYKHIKNIEVKWDYIENN